MNASWSASEPMQPTIYRARHNPLARGEREWRVEEDALVGVGADGRERAVAWRDIIGVRLCHEPARQRPWRYAIEIQPRNGRAIEIDNAHRVTRNVFEDRSASYTPFVREALARIAACSPGARALIGETPRRYFVLLLASLLGLCAAAVAMTVFATPLDNLPFATPAKLAIILLMAGVFWRWVIGAMPRGVALDAIPARAFPPEEHPRDLKEAA